MQHPQALAQVGLWGVMINLGLFGRHYQRSELTASTCKGKGKLRTCMSGERLSRVLKLMSQAEAGYSKVHINFEKGGVE